MGEAEKLFPSLRGSGSVWHQEARRAVQGWRGLTTLRAGSQRRGKGKPGCHRDSGRGRTVQQVLVLGLSPALVKIIVVLSLIIKILRSGLELDCYCSFSVLPSATSV